MTRPSPHWEPPEGYLLVPVEQGPQWRAGSTKRCRYRGGSPQRTCTEQATAELERGNGWWPYCPEHMYGRWVEDGKVMYWRAVPKETAQA